MPYYASHLEGDTSQWAITHGERKILELFNHERILVQSATWMNLERIDVALAWLDADPRHQAVFLTLMDPCTVEFPDHPRIHLVTPRDYTYFLTLVDEHFVKYTQDQVTPVSFDLKFLCYQRKVHEPRVILYDHLSDAAGLVTLSGRTDPQAEFNQNLSDSRLSETIFNSDQERATYMPNNCWSLGNLELWNQHFLTIVSETCQGGLNDPDRLFVSEKIFKPILGMRPFLHYGYPEVSELLESRGFCTFDEEFGFNPEPDYHQQAQELRYIVDNLGNLDALWRDLEPKIIHNHNHFSQAVQAEWQRVSALADYYKSLTH